MVPADTKLSLFIDLYTTAWRIDTVQQFFAPQDVGAILSIPLSSRLPSDCLVWTYTPKGLFTVKSAYKLAMSLADSAIASQASNT